MIRSRRRYEILFLFWALVWQSFPTQAQRDCDCFVKGTVKDQENHLPLPGATIYIQELQKGTVTDAGGHYRLEGLCQGTYTLLCRIIGYREVRQTVILEHTAEHNLLLSEESIHLNDVDVTARRTEALASQSVTSLEGRGLDQTRGQTLGEALRSLTGVTTLQTGASISKPVVHGLHSNRVLILNNGIRQEGQQWGMEHAPEIDPFVANRLTLVRGAAGVQYGSDAIGGVILVEPAPLPTSRALQGELNLVGFTNGRQGVASVRTESSFGPKNRFAWRAQGTLKRGGNLRTPDYYLDNTGLSEQNASLTLAYRADRFRSELYYSRFNTTLGIFSGAHIGSLSDLQTVLETGEPLVKTGFRYAIGRPNQVIAHELLKAKAIYQTRQQDRWSLTLARQYDDRKEYDLHRPRNDSLAALNRPELRFRLTTYTSDLVLEHRPLGRLRGSVGLSGLYQFNIMNGRPLIPNFRTVNLGAFWLEKYRTGRWEWEAGLRYDARQMQVFRFENRVLTRRQFNFHNASGTLGGVYTPSEHWTTRVNFGTAWRAPNVNELFSDGVHHGAASYEQGNAALRPETAYNLSLTAEYRSSRWQAEVVVFHNTIRNYIYLEPRPEPMLTIRGAFPAFRYAQTDARYAGLDASVEAKLLPRLTATSKLALLYVQDLRRQQPIVMTPPNRWENGLRYELGKWGSLRESYLGLGNQWVARQHRVPANSDFLPPPPAYSVWSLTAGTVIPLGQQQRLNLDLSVSNLFNTTYRDYLNRFRYFADEPGRNLSLRLRWQF